MTALTKKELLKTYSRTIIWGGLSIIAVAAIWGPLNEELLDLLLTPMALSIWVVGWLFSKIRQKLNFLNRFEDSEEDDAEIAKDIRYLELYTLAIAFFCFLALTKLWTALWT